MPRMEAGEIMLVMESMLRRLSYKRIGIPMLLKILSIWHLFLHAKRLAASCRKPAYLRGNRPHAPLALDQGIGLHAAARWRVSAARSERACVGARGTG